jgi:heme/copper-type cytochrome/quinol oxidase subunit 3
MSTTTRDIIDVSALPSHGFDTMSPVWWSNNLLLAIETSMFALLISCYFYLRQNFALWPPPIAELSAPLSPLPDLTFGTANTVLLVASCLPMVLTDVSARRGNRLLVQVGLTICLLCGCAAMVLRAFEFSAVKFYWDSNAYGSIVWFILGMHLLHLLTLSCETLLLTLWSFFLEFDMKHRVDITALAVYWYWVTGIWILLYGIIYFTPRVG